MAAISQRGGVSDGLGSGGVGVLMGRGYPQAAILSARDDAGCPFSLVGVLIEVTTRARRMEKGRAVGQVLHVPLAWEDAGDAGDEAALVRAAQADPRMFGGLYRRYVDGVYRYLRARTGSAEDAADLTQQVFLQALEALPGYRERGTPFAAWLFRIARNLANNWARRRPAMPLEWLAEGEWPRTGADQDPVVVAERRDELRRLEALLAELPAAKRELLALRFAGGLTAREIAAVVGKRDGAVKKQLARTLHELKERYGDG